MYQISNIIVTILVEITLSYQNTNRNISILIEISVSYLNTKRDISIKIIIFWWRYQSFDRITSILYQNNGWNISILIKISVDYENYNGNIRIQNTNTNIISLVELSEYLDNTYISILISHISWYWYFNQYFGIYISISSDYW